MKIKKITFVDFVALLGIRMTLGQRTIAIVAYDRIDPKDLPVAERLIAREIFGAVDQIPESARAILVGVAGARGGKSYVLGAAYLLWRALTADLSTLAPGERAAAVFVAPDVRLARIGLRYVVGMCGAVGDLDKMITERTKDMVVIARPDGASVAIQVLPATRGGSAVRGQSLVACVADEACFFQSSDGVRNVADIVDAVVPRVIAGGMLSILSTPWVKEGAVWDLFNRNLGNPQDAIACTAPTWVLRPDKKTEAMLSRERARDPENYEREFGAKWLEGGTSGFFDAEIVDLATEWRHAFKAETHTAGADFAFLSDASAIVIAARMGDVVRIVDMRERRPKAGSPLVPSVVCGEFAELAKRYSAAQIVADGHAKASVQEILLTHGVTFVDAPSSRPQIAASYTKFRDLLVSGKLILPSADGDPDDPKVRVRARFLKQLKDTVATPLPGGGLKISHPRVAGSHGDLVSAAVLAVHAANSVEASFLSGGARRFDRSWHSSTREWFETSEEYEAYTDARPPVISQPKAFNGPHNDWDADYGAPR